MKKFLSLLITLLLLIPAAMAELPPTAYVTITDDAGELVLAYVPVTLTDADGDGALTLCDALIAAHAAHHPQGADAFQAAQTAYGLSLTRLWGVENGGFYGYYLNDASAMSLADPIQHGDHVKAYCFTDPIGWSDTYCWFDGPMAMTSTGGALSMNLRAAGFDEMWNPVTLSVSGAVITIDGVETTFVTDAQGHADVTFAQSGRYIVSAVSDSMNLVPPVCIVVVYGE